MQKTAFKLALLVAAMVISDDTMPDARAAESGAASAKDMAQVEKGVATLAKALAKLMSWDVEGSLTVVTQDDFYKVNAGRSNLADKIAEFRIREMRQGDQLMISRERLGNESFAVLSESFYLNDKNLAHKMVGSRSMASIAPVGTVQGELIPGNWDTVLSIYSFLNLSIKSPYIPHVEPGVLASPAGWADVLAALPTAEITRDGAVTVTITRGDFKLEIEFAKLGDGSQRWPSSLRMLNKKNVLVQEINVTEYFMEGDSLGLPKKLRLNTFTDYQGKSLPIARWAYNFTRVIVNQPIDSSAMAFDPASVDTIWDVAKNTYVHVPR